MSNPSGHTPSIFDLQLWVERRNRASATIPAADFLLADAAEALAERLSLVPRPFPTAAIVGAGTGALARALQGRFGIEKLILIDPAERMLTLAAKATPVAEARLMQGDALPLEKGEADLVISNLVLHAANDPVGALVQARLALKPDGLFLGAMPGGRTLHELRAALAEAETRVEGGLSPRVAPMGEVRDLGGLLQRAGFQMPVADVEPLTVNYASPLHLMRELRAMGETSVLTHRRKTFLRRATLMEACRVYQDSFGTPDGRIPATFDIVYLTGRSPGPGQPVPKRPGSASQRLADALGTVERSAGEKAGD